MSGWLDGRQDEILSGKEIGFETLWREKYKLFDLKVNACNFDIGVHFIFLPMIHDRRRFIV